MMTVKIIHSPLNIIEISNNDFPVPSNERYGSFKEEYFETFKYDKEYESLYNEEGRGNDVYLE